MDVGSEQRSSPGLTSIPLFLRISGWGLFRKGNNLLEVTKMR